VLLIASCNKKEFSCKCDKSEISKNDSLLDLPSRRIERNLFLKIFNQPHLKDLNCESYRLSIHIIGANESWFYTFKKQSRQSKLLIQKFSRIEGGYKKDMSRVEFFKSLKYKLDSERSIIFKGTEWEDFKNLVNRNCFWTTSIIEDKYGGLDGATYILEGYQPNVENCSGKVYHEVSRWSPNSSDFGMICKKILTYADRNN